MNNLSYITSNSHKAQHMGRLIGQSIQPISINIPEIQSLDLDEVILYKTRTAFEMIKKPLFIDDVSLIITAMNRLPGPFIKFFIQELGAEKICQIVNLFDSRKAIAQSIIGYHDGTSMHFFKGEVIGKIADSPSGTRGFGWDEIFIPDGYSQIRAEMDEKDYDTTSPRAVALHKFKDFLKHTEIPH